MTVALDAFDFLWIELTPRCNLRCTHCYAESGPEQPLHAIMDVDDWKRTLSEASALGCRSVQFIGGEPTLYPGLAPLIEYAREVGFTTVEVFTNGTAFTPRLKELFTRAHVDLAFSVYADSPDVHDAITQQVGSLARTLASIRWALDAGLAVRAGVVAMAANAEHVDGARRMLETMGVHTITVDRIRGIGRGADEVHPEEQLGEMCGACGRGQLCVSSDGQVSPCVFSRFWPVADAKAPLAGALHRPELRRFRELVRAGRADALDSQCGPEKPAPPCVPERPAPKCPPEIPPPLCNPEKPAPRCPPEIPPPPCIPERAESRKPPPPPPCQPERPPCAVCQPEPPPPPPRCAPNDWCQPERACQPVPPPPHCSPVQ
ncbi:MAG TPA: radical SAM protein [Candidatus Acidoferrum sp.]|nr:radical SAM protein [Candidatus Acidoferrum sp.]